MSTKTLSRILLSALILGPWVLSGYLVSTGNVVGGVLLFVLGLGALLWLWKPWRLFKPKRHSETKQSHDTAKHKAKTH